MTTGIVTCSSPHDMGFCRDPVVPNLRRHQVPLLAPTPVPPSGKVRLDPLGGQCHVPQLFQSTMEWTQLTARLTARRFLRRTAGRPSPMSSRSIRRSEKRKAATTNGALKKKAHDPHVHVCLQTCSCPVCTCHHLPRLNTIAERRVDACSWPKPGSIGARSMSECSPLPCSSSPWWPSRRLWEARPVLAEREK